MRYTEIKETFLDYPDNESLAVVVFLSGCKHNCPGCQNKELQDPNYGIEITPEELTSTIKDYCKRADTNKIVFSGGDPFYNIPEILIVLDNLRDYDVCVYTGYNINKAEEFVRDIAKPLYLKCGTYKEELRDSNMGKTEDKFVLASTNQAFYKWDGFNYNQISLKNILRFE